MPLTDRRTRGAALLCYHAARMSAAVFKRVLIANRGEVAVRIGNACRELGITPVFAVSEGDLNAPYVANSEYVLIGAARATDSYLNPERLVAAAKQSRCAAIHPGWGFLSENPLFPALAEQHGIRFIGPSASAMTKMGKKNSAKAVARLAGLSLIPGSEGILPDWETAVRVAESVGFPVIIKAESGGGGRGMRVAREVSEVRQAFEDASAEARAAFGDHRVYLEKLIENGRHVELQIMADRFGSAIHLGERDCTVQRNHQKLIEESPAPKLDSKELARTAEAAIRATKAIGYSGAGTMEFLLDETGTLRFMEMNTRLQVEHPVTEMRTGIDLAKTMISVAANRPLQFAQTDIRYQGHVIECRINAENPDDNFRPSPGKITSFEVPQNDPSVRVDTHVASGYTVPPFYDSLICKVIVKGTDRTDATQKMIGALKAMKVEGVHTTIPLHLRILASTDFKTLNYNTRRIPGFES